jgi:hypothetical protein
MTSAMKISSSVARKAATRWVGSFWMKPTVSVSRMSGNEPWNCGRLSFLCYTSEKETIKSV